MIWKDCSLLMLFHVGPPLLHIPPPRQDGARNSPLPVLSVEEELELLEEEVVVMAEEELQEEAVVVLVEEAVEAGTSPSMSAALWECDRQRALMGSKPSCRETSRTVNFWSADEAASDLLTLISNKGLVLLPLDSKRKFLQI